MNELIQIQTFNPYEAIYPGRKLVSLETLILIKELKAKGREIVVLPDDGQPFEYLYKKGVREFLSDPINILLVGIPINIATGLLTGFVQKLIERKKTRNPNININSENLIIKNKESNKYYTYNGKEIPDEKNKVQNDKRNDLRKAFDRVFNTKSPNPQFPFPILIEHEPRIVGWCILWEEEEGLMLKGIITDKHVRKKIDKGKIKGASVTGIAKKSICTICNSNYTDCPHITGEIYDGIMCSNRIFESDFIEVSLIKIPINEKCLLGLK